MGVWRHLARDLGEMLTHRLTVGRRHDDCGACRPIGADCTEQVSGIVTVVAHSRGTRATGRPNIGERAFLADPRLVLEPYFHGLPDKVIGQARRYEIGEVFLKAS
jgi:hypothetical protein